MFISRVRNLSLAGSIFVYAGITFSLRRDAIVELPGHPGWIHLVDHSLIFGPIFQSRYISNGWTQQQQQQQGRTTEDDPLWILKRNIFLGAARKHSSRRGISFSSPFPFSFSLTPWLTHRKFLRNDEQESPQSIPSLSFFFHTPR